MAGILNLFRYIKQTNKDMRKLKVLIGCEESQAICKAFRNAGHEAYSNDIDACSGENPEWHLQMDVMKAIDFMEWDLIILHPPCTYMAVSGNRWYGTGMVGNSKRMEAVKWTEELWNKAINKCKFVALENPVGVLNKFIPTLPKPQYIQPWQFGHGETKRTGFWLHNLPNLTPTDIVEGREQLIWKMGPSAERGRLRSKTYEGIAQAIVNQWGNFVLNN